MKKRKSLFTYEAETLNSKELEEDIKQAEEIISKLKNKIDPEEERAKRKRKFWLETFDLIGSFCITVLLIFAVAFGFSIGVSHAERLYNYSVTTGIITPVE